MKFNLHVVTYVVAAALVLAVCMPTADAVATADAVTGAPRNFTLSWTKSLYGHWTQAHLRASPSTGNVVVALQVRKGNVVPYVAAFSSTSGKLAWNHTFAPAAIYSNGLPIIETYDNKVASIYSPNNVDYDLTVLSAATGDKAWVFKTSKFKLHQMARLDQRLFVYASDKISDSLWQLYVLEFMLHTGRLMSKIAVGSTSNEPYTVRLCADATSATVYASFPKSITAIDANTGKTRWVKAQGWSMPGNTACNQQGVAIVNGSEFGGKFEFTSPEGKTLWTYVIPLSKGPYVNDIEASYNAAHDTTQMFVALTFEGAFSMSPCLTSKRFGKAATKLGNETKAKKLKGTNNYPGAVIAVTAGKKDWECDTYSTISNIGIDSQGNPMTLFSGLVLFDGATGAITDQFHRAQYIEYGIIGKPVEMNGVYFAQAMHWFEDGTKEYLLEAFTKEGE